ncbi:glycosyltransferase [Chitinibacter sp. GC72]|uniref:glycosyltransferase n=1 Tax=Chitinibacter sp. GC72 TaxID=1526917 RepID=UPI0012F90173|nr:glycosyltransferase [Chitinibacter sp. GC72]
MNLKIVMDGRFDWVNGFPFSAHMHYEKFGKTFLVNKEIHLQICARAYGVSHARGYEVIGENVSFKRLASYKGFKQFLANLFHLLGEIKNIAASNDTVILYTPGTLPFICGLLRRLLRKPYGIIVVADPQDQLSKNALKHPLQPIVQPAFVAIQKYLTKYSCASLYVTKKFLQDKYPNLNKASEFGASDVYIPESTFLAEAYPPSKYEKKSLSLVYVAMLAQEYKGHDILLKALAECKEMGVDLSLNLVGEGRLKKQLEILVEQLGLEENVNFLGLVEHGASMCSVLDSADIFVMPSRAEGMPRAVIEAMARGLPVISTSVGGIPEIVDSQFLVSPEDSTLLAEKIAELVMRPDILASASFNNLVTARGFTIERNVEVKHAFLRDVLANVKS